MQRFLFIAAPLLSATALAQDFDLVRSQIKIGGGSSVAGNFAINGNISMAESNQRMTGSQFAVQGNFVPLTFIPAPPVPAAISIAKAGGNLQLTWPKIAVGYLLESTSNLRSTPVWNIENFTRTTVGSTSSVSIPITSTPQVYRLRHAGSLP